MASFMTVMNLLSYESLPEDKNLTKCDKCDADAVYTQRNRNLLYTRSTAQRFCEECFSSHIENKVFSNISKFGMIEPRDRILICVSGEKDSMVMFHLVREYMKEFKIDADLFAITVNEGISDLRNKCVKLVRKTSDEYDIPFIEWSFMEEFGFTLDDIFRKRSENSFRICMYCSALRGKIIADTKKRLDITKVATGMNLNDTIEHAIMCLMKGVVDLEGLPIYKIEDGNVIFISPVYNLKGVECGMYALLNDVDFISEDCTYHNEHLSNDVRHSLNILEERNPGILNQLYAGYVRLLNVSTEVKETPSPIERQCNVCGIKLGDSNTVPNSNTCFVCQLISEIK